MTATTLGVKKMPRPTAVLVAEHLVVFVRAPYFRLALELVKGVEAVCDCRREGLRVKGLQAGVHLAGLDRKFILRVVLHLHPGNASAAGSCSEQCMVTTFTCRGY